MERYEAILMKEIKNILILLFGVLPLFGDAQNQRDLCDENEPIMIGWEAKRNLFLPKDLSEFPLLVESLNKFQTDSLMKLSISEYEKTKKKELNMVFLDAIKKEL
jgi:hypothetical protein